jgi:hypothetical protein
MMALRSGVDDIDVDATANDVEIQTFRSTIDAPLVSTRAEGPKVRKCRRVDHRISI